jgi:hypothetical protein
VNASRDKQASITVSIAIGAGLGRESIRAEKTSLRLRTKGVSKGNSTWSARWDHAKRARVYNLEPPRAVQA